MPNDHRLVSFVLTITLALFVAPNTFAYDDDDYYECLKLPAHLLRDQEFQEYQEVIDDCQRFYIDTGTSPPTRPAPRPMTNSEMFLGAMQQAAQQWNQQYQGTTSYGAQYGDNEQVCVSGCGQEQVMCTTSCLQEAEFGSPEHQACQNACSTGYMGCLNSCR